MFLGQVPSPTQARYIITGGPGVGKTTILKHLEKLGEAVVYEAATDIIKQETAEGKVAPWTDPRFEETIIALQEKRQMEAALTKAKRVFFDRTPIDTLTYRLMSKNKVTKELTNAVGNIMRERFYHETVFFIESLNFYKNDEVRHETQKEALEIQNKLKETYTLLGFKIISIPSDSVEERVKKMLSHIQNPNPGKFLSLHPLRFAFNFASLIIRNATRAAISSCLPTGSIGR